MNALATNNTLFTILEEFTGVSYPYIPVLSVQLSPARVTPPPPTFYVPQMTPSSHVIAYANIGQGGGRGTERVNYKFR